MLSNKGKPMKIEVKKKEKEDGESDNIEEEEEEEKDENKEEEELEEELEEEPEEEPEVKVKKHTKVSNKDKLKDKTLKQKSLKENKQIRDPLQSTIEDCKQQEPLIINNTMIIKPKEVIIDSSKYEFENKSLIEENLKLSTDNSLLLQKLNNLRKSIVEIKDRLDKDITLQLDHKKKLLKQQNTHLDDLNNTINQMKQSIIKKQRLEEDNVFFQNHIDQILKEHSVIEELIHYQEQDIKRLSEQTYKINEVLLIQGKQYEQFEKGCNELTESLDDKQKEINFLTEMIKRKETDEKKQNDLIAEKEAEIHLLQGIINSTKTQHTLTSQKEKKMIKQLNKVKKENKELNTLMQSTTQKKLPENVIDFHIEESRPLLNEIEEENFKELDELMKKVLED